MITKIINISVLQLLYEIVIRSFRAKIKKQRKKKRKSDTIWEEIKKNGGFHKSASYAKNVQQTMRSSRSNSRLLGIALTPRRPLNPRTAGAKLKCWRHVMEITLKTH